MQPDTTSLTIKKENIMALRCDQQDGMIEVDAIISAVNKNETDIAALGGDGGLIDARVTTNENDIVDLNTRVITLENSSGAISGLDGRVTANEADILILEGSVVTNTADIVSVENSIVAVGVDVTNNATNIQTNTDGIANLVSADIAFDGRISDNESDIAALQAAGGLGGEAIYLHEETGMANGGSSVASTWTPRNIATEKLNTLGAVAGTTSVTLPAGEYDLETHAVATGSVHQTRINIGGSSYIYGVTAPDSGMSTAIGRIVLASATVISIETNVKTAVVDTGFGVAGTFTPANVYVSLHIEKVG